MPMSPSPSPARAVHIHHVRSCASRVPKGDGGDAPDDGADGHGADAVDIHGLDRGDAVGGAADLELGDLGASELVTTCGALETGPLAMTELALDRRRPVAVVHGPVCSVRTVVGTVLAHSASLPVGVGATGFCWHAESR